MRRLKAFIKRSKRGMTLVELIVAFALLAIIGVLLSGPIIYTFRTSVWATNKTSISLLTAGELVSYANGGAVTADVVIVTDSDSLIMTFDATTSISIPVTYISATGSSTIQNGSQPQHYKVFVP